MPASISLGLFHMHKVLIERFNYHLNNSLVAELVDPRTFETSLNDLANQTTQLHVRSRIKATVKRMSELKRNSNHRILNIALLHL